ncbi:MAG TPA: NAD-dependent epimerase/dehydratase family protein [Phycisphaerales bacterium]|nr:NAD-dependent epimerase/dehydratase family protein [Phycisphaerales bacterium]
MSERARYVVTGGAGFVGSNLVAALLRHDPRAEVVVVDDCRTGSFANLMEAFERQSQPPFRGRMITESFGKVNAGMLVEGARAVFHLAAITDTTVSDEAEMIRENAESFRPLLHACISQGVPLVYASSAATYGTPQQAGQRKAFPLEAAGRPSNVYGFSKWLMEAAHAEVAGALGATRSTVVGLRYFNVFGPCEGRKGHMASMVYQLANRMLAGEPPRVFRDGSQARDQVYVDDVVTCTLAGAGIGTGTRPRSGVYNVGSGVATTFNQIIAALREELGITEAERPTDYIEMSDYIRSFYQDFTLADISATQSGLGWTPAWKPAEAIRAYARYLKGRKGG